VLVASESLMKIIPKLLGNVLVKIGKFPIAVGENETIGSKIEEVKSTVRYISSSFIMIMKILIEEDTRLRNSFWY
jgi:hypothetical protein